MPHIITSPEELTPEWLTAALHTGGALGAGRVATVENRRIGDGQLGATYLVTVTYEGAADGSPERLVAKLPTPDETNRKYAASLGCYTREVAFYGQLAQQLDVRTPHCFSAVASEDGERFTLLLEDLTPATECGQVAGAGVDQARRAVEQAAALHGSSWRRDDLAGLDWLITGHGAWHQLAAAAQQVPSAYLARYEGLLDEPTQRVATALESGIATRFVEHATLPVCLWHSDYRLDNLMFDARGGDVPLAVVDWQSVMLGNGPIDTSYFLGAGLPTETRREHEEDLVRTYHQALRDHGAQDYDWDTCWREYRLNTMAGFIIAMVVGLSTERSEQADALFTTMASRHAAHIEDHDAVALLDA